MRFRFLTRRARRLEERRAQMIAETSLWLTEALRRPELATRIPMVPAGTARFPRSLTRAFWDPLLRDSDAA